MRSFVRWAAGLRSQGPPSLAGAGRHWGPTSVVPFAAPADPADLQALRLGTLGDQLTDLAGLGGLVRVRGPQVRFQGGGGDQCGAGGVVDHLGDHVPGGPVDHEAGPRSRPGDPLAHPEVTAGARRALARSLDGDSHGYLPAFPTLRRTCSSAYRTPLPLYGSGRRILRMRSEERRGGGECGSGCAGRRSEEERV